MLQSNLSSNKNAARKCNSEIRRWSAIKWLITRMIYRLHVNWKKKVLERYYERIKACRQSWNNKNKLKEKSRNQYTGRASEKTLSLFRFLLLANSLTIKLLLLTFALLKDEKEKEKKNHSWGIKRNLQVEKRPLKKEERRKERNKTGIPGRPPPPSSVDFGFSEKINQAR